MLVVIGYLIVAHYTNPPGIPGRTFPILLLTFWPLLLIWFPRQFGNFTGYVRFHYIDQKSPPVLIAMMGWLLLVGLPLVLYFMLRAN